VADGLAGAQFASSTMALRSFVWWFIIGALMTLSVLMVQGGVRDLWEGTQPAGDRNVFVYFGTTLFGGGLLAGCVALVMNRLR
jgi:hypothetical protein